jgi:hypothetical protein
MFFNAAPPFPQPAHRLGPVIESHDSGAQPLSNGAARWANRWSIWLPHGLFRSGSVLEPEGPASLEGSVGSSEGPASLEGSVGSSLGTMREGVVEVGGVVAVRGASGPWGPPLRPMKMHAVRHIAGAPMGLMTTEIWCSSSSSSPSPSSSP